MKKFFLAILSALFVISASAQLNGDGYYRVKNYASGRYITITDDIVGEVNMSSTTPDLGNITTWKGFDYVKSSAASVFYFEAVGSKYNIKGQGTSIYDIAQGRGYLTIKSASAENTYVFQVSSSGVTLRLYDSATSRDKGYVATKGQSSEYTYWYILPVNSSDNYLGLQPTVKIGDAYYGTFYASFPFKVASSGVSIYYVDGVKEGAFQLKEITDEVKPASTPIVFKCTSNDPAANQITPVATGGTAVTDNYLGGTLFASTKDDHEKYVKYDNSTMRVLGADGDGNLAFISATSDMLTEGKYIPMNTAWLYIPSGLTGNFKNVSRDDYTGIRTIENETTTADKGVYSLTGVRITNDNNLRPGIYIKNGKKVVIK